MPYLRPPRLVRQVFNPIAMRFGIGGTQALTVAGRVTGVAHRVPVIAVEVDGVVHLVSPRGETDWARNLRVAGACRLGPHGDERPWRATEVPVDDRAPIIAAYRAQAGRAVRSFFEKLPDAADHPVFRLEPA